MYRETLAGTHRPALEELEHPPTPDQGSIAQVQLDYRSLLAVPGDLQDCQQCGESIRLDREHVRVMVWLEGERFRHARRPVFCSSSCWSQWGSRR